MQHFQIVSIRHEFRAAMKQICVDREVAKQYSTHIGPIKTVAEVIGNDDWFFDACIEMAIVVDVCEIFAKACYSFEGEHEHLMRFRFIFS
jgi:hypothetical protein